MKSIIQQKFAFMSIMGVILILVFNSLINSQSITKHPTGSESSYKKVHKTPVQRKLLTPDFKMNRHDLHLNTVTSDNQTTIMSQDFESDFPSDLWALSSGDYEWAKRNVTAHNGNYSAWAIGGGTIGSTIPYNTNYTDNISTVMMYGPFDLSGADSSEYSFFVNLNAESDYDFLEFLASNDNENYYGYALSGTTSGDWVEFSLSLNEVPVDNSFENFCGSQTVWIAFLFISDVSINFPNGAFVDDIVLQKKTLITYANDVGVSSLNLPNFLQFGESLPINVTIKNYGTQTQTNFPVSYSINGGTPFTENFTGSLSAGSSSSFTFSESWNPQEEGEYQLLVWTGLTNDEDISNDNAGKDITVSTDVNEVIFTENFESYPEGVLADATGSPWVRLNSSRNGNVTTTWPHSGAKNFMTSSFIGNTEIDYVNLNLFTKPAMLTVEFWYTPDGFFVYKDFAEVGLGYATSKYQMSMCTGFVGYDHDVIFWADGMPENVNVFDELEYGSLSGSPVHNYFRVEFDFNNNLVNFYIGSSDQAPLRSTVEFDGRIDFNSLYFAGGLNYTYIDDIKISARGTYEMKKIVDVGVADMNIPAEVGLGCSVPVNVVIENFGNVKVGGFPVYYKIDNEPPVTETFTDSLEEGATSVFTFSSPWVPSQEGIYHFRAWTAHADDSDISNDTLTTAKEVTIVEYEPDPQGWFGQTCTRNDALLAVHFSDVSTGWVAGRDGTVLKTINGGRTWQDFSFDDFLSFIEDVNFVSSSTGLIVGFGGSNDIRRTTDGGQNWQGIDIGVAWPKDVSFLDMNNGWMTGITASSITVNIDEWGSISISTTSRHSTIWKTEDGGATWNENVLSSSNWLYSIIFSDANTGWTVGDNGLILQTTNGGELWTTQSSGTTEKLYAVDFVDLQNGWAVGQNGTILRTTNGGTNWTHQTSGTTNLLTDTYFIDALNGWAVGNSGLILHTVDGGQTWLNQTSGTGTSLNALCFVDSQTGWVAGNNGTILKTSSSGVVVAVDPSENTLPQKFQLSQNYPNPFNPKTIIGYQLPEITEVDLSIYNMLGQKVVTLVSGQQNAGYYNVEWDASGYASGVYLYRLTTDKGFVQTQKLVLLK